jgi:acyl carrier protein
MDLDDLIPVLKTVFPNLEQINEGLTRNDIPDWDSINHLNLIIELEDAFSISFSTDEIQQIDSVAEILKLVSQKHNI